MRLGTEQPAKLRVTRRRSDLVSSPHPPPREIEALTKVVPYQLRSRSMSEYGRYVKSRLGLKSG